MRLSVLGQQRRAAVLGEGPLERRHRFGDFFQAPVLLDRLPGRALGAAGWLLLSGVLLFCGSLYLLLAGAPRLLGALTPLGGLALIAGWCTVAIALRGRWAAGHDA